MFKLKVTFSFFDDTLILNCTFQMCLWAHFLAHSYIWRIEDKYTYIFIPAFLNFVPFWCSSMWSTSARKLGLVSPGCFDTSIILTKCNLKQQTELLHLLKAENHKPETSVNQSQSLSESTDLFRSSSVPGCIERTMEDQRGASVIRKI